MTDDPYEIFDDEIGTLRWFGETWYAPVNDPRAFIETPVGETCPECSTHILPGDRGIRIPYMDGGFLSYHLPCWFRVLGVPGPWD